MRSDRLTLVSPPSLLQDRVTDFLNEKRAAALSRRSIAAYTDVLGAVLLPFCQRSGITEPGQIGARELNALSAGLLDGTGSRSGRPLSKPSVASYARTINVFLEWLTKQGETVSSRVQKPRLPKRVVDVLSREDIRALEDAAPTERDKLIVRILADTGVRLGELLTADPLRQEPDPEVVPEGPGQGRQGAHGPHPAQARDSDRSLRPPDSEGVAQWHALPGQPAQPEDRRVRATHRFGGGAPDPRPRPGRAQATSSPHLVRRSFVTEQRHSGDG